MIQMNCFALTHETSFRAVLMSATISFESSLTNAVDADVQFTTVLFRNVLWEQNEE